MAGEILQEVSAQHESDSGLRSGVSSTTEQFRAGPKSRTNRGRSRLPAPLLAAVLVFTGAGPVFAADAEPSDSERLVTKARTLAQRWDRDPRQIPIHLEFEEARGRLRGAVYSIVEQPFGTVSEALGRPASWCEILPLHFNVKSCTYAKRTGDQPLTVYLGRKFYQEPDAARRLALSFQVLSADQDYFEINLRAKKGRVRTRNYVLSLSAVPLAAERTFVHLGYSHDVGLTTRIAMYGYLHTLGRGKVGFSVVGRSSDGRPIHVGGLQGVIERNAMRYHLAVKAYLETLEVSEPQRFDRRIERWFELTGGYREQLFEIGRDEYLRSKRREWENQARLQGAIQVAPGPTIRTERLG